MRHPLHRLVLAIYRGHHLHSQCDGDAPRHRRLPGTDTVRCRQSEPRPTAAARARRALLLRGGAAASLRGDRPHRSRAMAIAMLACVFAASFGGAGAAWASCPNCVVTLGLAGKYAAYGSHGVDMTISSGNTVVNGDVGIGPGPSCSLTFSGGGTINGDLDYDPACTISITGGSTVTGSQTAMSMSPQDSDALAAATAP